jgi:hypothetical protein
MIRRIYEPLSLWARRIFVAEAEIEQATWDQSATEPKEEAIGHAA